MSLFERLPSANGEKTVSVEMDTETRQGTLTFRRLGDGNVEVEMVNSVPPQEIACYGGSRVDRAIQGHCEWEVYRQRETMGALCLSLMQKLSDKGDRAEIDDTGEGRDWIRNRQWARREKGFSVDGMGFRSVITIEGKNASEVSLLNAAVQKAQNLREDQIRAYYRTMLEHCDPKSAVPSGLHDTITDGVFYR